MREEYFPELHFNTLEAGSTGLRAFKAWLTCKSFRQVPVPVMRWDGFSCGVVERSDVGAPRSARVSSESGDGCGTSRSVFENASDFHVVPGPGEQRMRESMLGLSKKFSRPATMPDTMSLSVAELGWILLCCASMLALKSTARCFKVTLGRLPGFSVLICGREVITESERKCSSTEKI